MVFGWVTSAPVFSFGDLNEALKWLGHSADGLWEVGTLSDEGVNSAQIKLLKLI